jgi:hypothetical protein
VETSIIVSAFNASIDDGLTMISPFARKFCTKDCALTFAARLGCIVVQGEAPWPSSRGVGNNSIGNEVLGNKNTAMKRWTEIRKEGQSFGLREVLVQNKNETIQGIATIIDTMSRSAVNLTSRKATRIWTDRYSFSQHFFFRDAKPLKQRRVKTSDKAM